MLSLICPWHCSHRGTDTGAACLSCHLKLQCSPGMGILVASLQHPCSENDNFFRKLATRRGYPGKVLLSRICPWHCWNRGTETGTACLSYHLKRQTYPRDGFPCSAPPAALLRKCERLQIARSQKGLAWKAVAQPHLPIALLAQRHRDWGCLLVLSPQTSNVA